MNEIELLAPARDAACGMAAVDCGADAVYIGAPKFGAREAAGNSLEDLARLVEHAHRYRARVYATVNTLVNDEEIPQALRLIAHLYEAGVDGLIIQDVGLLECDLPPLPLIASTQMHNNTPERVAFLEQVGISRTILARELDLEQVRQIRARTNVELEFFVHGALCVCYSGQCYASWAMGGRSGNRGQCAQPCRKPYTLLDGRGRPIVTNKHLLSLRDLNLSEHLRELIEAGICSFKIEGRLKDKAYVTNVVSYYRNRLDNVLSELGMSKSSSGTSYVGFAPDPNKTFNRGYTTYFLHGRGESPGSIDTPKMVGERVGRITGVGKQGITVDGAVELRNGDGICFFDSRGELRGTLVNRAQGRSLVPEKHDGIEPGTVVYRNSDHRFLTELAKAHIERRVGVELTLRETPGGLLLSAMDEDGVAAEFSIECEHAAAEKPESALENIRRQLAKCGGTGFECADVRLELNGAWFVPISTLNALRRGALESLEAERARSYPRRTGGPAVNDFPYPAKHLSFEGNALNSLAVQFYQRHGVESIEPAAESGLDLRGRRIMTTRYCILHQIGRCPRFGGKPRPEEPLSLVDAEGHRLELRFECSRCEMEVFLVER